MGIVQRTACHTACPAQSRPLGVARCYAAGLVVVLPFDTSLHASSKGALSEILTAPRSSGGDTRGGSLDTQGAAHHCHRHLHVCLVRAQQPALEEPADNNNEPMTWSSRLAPHASSRQATATVRPPTRSAAAHVSRTVTRDPSTGTAAANNFPSLSPSSPPTRFSGLNWMLCGWACAAQGRRQPCPTHSILVARGDESRPRHAADRSVQPVTRRRNKTTRATGGGNKDEASHH